MAKARYALVREDGVVWTVTEWDSAEAPGWTPPDGTTAIPCGHGVGPRWTWNGTSFLPAKPPAPTVPPTIPMFRGRIVLRDHGLLSSVRQAARAMGEDSDINIMLEYSNYWGRQDPGVVQMQAALGMTDEQMDAMFIEAGAPEE